MKNILLLIFGISTLALSAQHTFSIVAVDSLTKEVGAAGATCISGSANIGGVKIINDLIPGRGAINSQAWICIPNINLENGIARMEEGDAPEEILDWLINNDRCNASNFNPQFRQYGIVDFDSLGQPRSIAYTGASADEYKGHIIGDNYAIQGNILLGAEVLEAMEKGFTETEGPLHAKLMAAMQGANIAGADARCLSAGTSSTTTFLKVAKPTDDKDKPYLFIDLPELPAGQEPIDALQILYDQFLATSSSEYLTSQDFNIWPNPVKNIINIKAPLQESIIAASLVDNAGKNYQLKIQGEQIHLKDISPGIYILNLETKKGQIIQKKIIIQ